MTISKSGASAPKKSTTAGKTVPKVAAKAEKAPTKKVASPKVTEARVVAPRKRRSPSGDANALLGPELRHSMICEAAYYLAERRGFSGGDPVADWKAAEVQIDQLYSKNA